MSNPVKNSYGEILKSSSIAGGSQIIGLILGMVRTKFVALLLGTSGVGLIGLYESAFGLVGTLTGLGIGQSAVRQVAEAHGSGNALEVGRTVRVLRRMCWATGLLGSVTTALLAYPLSVWIFGSESRTVPIAILGSTLLLVSLAAGQAALLRGVRRIGDLARMQILSSFASLFVSVGLYAWLGESGIVPVFIVSAALNLGFSWWFARRISVPSVDLDWVDTIREGRKLVTLGLAFMFSSLLGAGVTITTRAWLLSRFGLEANGLYQAAWSISGVFGGFVLTAMAMDFYPRLTAAAADNALVNQLVNEQLEIGLLLALPGLLATIIFSPWIIHLLYSSEFTGASDLLPWFVLGIFGRVVCWPMGFIQLAKGSSRWFAISQAAFNVVHLVFIWLGMQWLGLVGVAVAFAGAYGLFGVLIYLVSKRLSNFQFSGSVRNLIVQSAIVLGAAFLATRFASAFVVWSGGCVLVGGCGVLCLRRICCRLGPEHRICVVLRRLPWVGHWASR